MEKVPGHGTQGPGVGVLGDGQIQARSCETRSDSSVVIPTNALEQFDRVPSMRIHAMVQLLSPPEKALLVGWLAAGLVATWC